MSQKFREAYQMTQFNDKFKIERSPGPDKGFTVTCDHIFFSSIINLIEGLEFRVNPEFLFIARFLVPKMHLIRDNSFIRSIIH